jgi:Predicted membrane protein (DUF2306)
MATTAEGLRGGGLEPLAAGNFALMAAVRLWFGVAVAGQLFFVAHIVSFYGRAAVAGDFARWNKTLSHGYVAGDHLGNAVMGVHLAMAAFITFGGPIQLIPQIRARFPAFHRWSGRAYIAFAVLASASALYLSLIRGESSGGFFQRAAIDVNAVLILLCAAMALRYALARQFAVHRRWAIRLFLVVSGVWFFRAGLFFWILINHGPVGFNPHTFEGPALVVLGFAQYLVPLTVFELYLRTRQRAGAAARFAMAALLVLLTVAMGIGIVGHGVFVVTSGVAF